MCNRTRPVILLETAAGNNIQFMCEQALDHARRWGQVVVFEFNGAFMYADPKDKYSDVMARFTPLFER